MGRAAWTHPRVALAAHRRAGGRRRYNAERRRQAALRLIPLARQIAAVGALKMTADGMQLTVLPRHMIASLAKVLGLHRATVWRDVQRLRRWPSRSKYSRDTGLVTVRLYGLGVFVCRSRGRRHSRH